MWLTAFAALGGTVALGQGAVPCTAIADDAERLACYDRALRPAPAAAPSAPAAATAAPQSTPAAPVDEPRRERRVREPAAPAPAAAPAAAPAPRVLVPRGDEIVPIVVVSLRALPGRETTFTADDGSTWVQTDSQRVNVPDTPFAAELKPGVMGSYFLVPKQGGRAVRVRQAQR